MIIRNNQKGIALTVAIVAIIMLMFVAAAVLTISYHNKKLADSVAGKRTLAYYRAQAGVVDAQWRLRTDPGGLFAANGPDWAPPPYSLDIDGDGVADVTVTISAVIDPASGTRQITTNSSY